MSVSRIIHSWHKKIKKDKNCIFPLMLLVKYFVLVQLLDAVGSKLLQDDQQPLVNDESGLGQVNSLIETSRYRVAQKSWTIGSLSVRKVAVYFARYCVRILKQ